MKRDDRDACETDFFRSCVPTVATIKQPAITSKDRIFIVDGGASLHMVGCFFSSTDQEATVSTKGNGRTLRFTLAAHSPFSIVIGQVMQRNGIYPLVDT